MILDPFLRFMYVDLRALIRLSWGIAYVKME